MVKAAHERSPRLGVLARVWRLLSFPFAGARARRDAEDARDLALIEEVRARNEPTIPHEEIMRELGLR